jgi:hypothetical protein
VMERAKALSLHDLGDRATPYGKRPPHPLIDIL